MNHGGVFDLCMAGYASDYRHKFLKVKPISDSKIMKNQKHLSKEKRIQAHGHR